MRKIALSLLVASTCTAQNYQVGQFSGAVVDSSGRAIGGASILLQSGQIKKQDTTKQDGKFFFPLLRPGSYKITVGAPGYRTAFVERAEVVPHKNTVAKIALRHGPESDNIQLNRY